MVGGGSRRDDGAVGLSNKNVFAALETLKKKKKSDKGKGSSKGPAVKEPEPPVFWAQPLKVTSWADVDDDEDYYAITAPPQPVWGMEEPPKLTKETPALLEEMLQESESEDEGLDEGDDDAEVEPAHESKASVPIEQVLKKSPPAPVVPKDTERQLSKKELKKKELAELEAVLAELGISGKDGQNAGQDEAKGVDEEKKSEENSGNDEKVEAIPALSESKTSKKKKAKKEKSFKEVRDPLDQPNSLGAEGPNEVAGAEREEEDTSTVDMKERLKKMASMKKKKSSKEMDAAAKAAAIEAAARSARLAAAKKKEKNHYNQQPVR